MSEGKFGSGLWKQYIEGHMLRFTPGDRTEINKLTFNHLTKNNNPSISAKRFSASQK